MSIWQVLFHLFLGFVKICQECFPEQGVFIFFGNRAVTSQRGSQHSADLSDSGRRIAPTSARRLTCGQTRDNRKTTLEISLNLYIIIHIYIYIIYILYYINLYYIYQLKINSKDHLELNMSIWRQNWGTLSHGTRWVSMIVWGAWIHPES